MNLVDHWVTEILSTPEERYTKFWVRVSFTCEGGTGETNLMFNTLAKAEAVKVGDKFLG